MIIIIIIIIIIKMIMMIMIIIIISIISTSSCRKEAAFHFSKQNHTLQKSLVVPEFMSRL